MRATSLFFILCSLFLTTQAQPDRWQQRVKYKMNVDVDVNSNKFTGKQTLAYTNNSTDKLDRVFYHLYWNAFQPGSSMDVRSQELGKINIGGKPDWDTRVKDRIANLKPEEIGYQKIISLKMNGVPQPFKYHETILEVDLTKAILPKTTVTFEMEFEAQVPLQVRRSGRDNPKTNVRYSMSQWYPKMCEYDYEGWHPTPYVAREFYGVWGDFDVTINIDKNYKIGATGVLVNANEIGWGYDKPGTELKPTVRDKRSWHFVGNNIHDFVWAADPEYKHLVRKMPGNGPVIHVIYNFIPDSPGNDSAWERLADAAVKVLPFIEKNFGKYPYPQYSFLHGGDGGMEYPMATLIHTPGLGTAFHEWTHSWFQMMLGTNESLYPWMDEGFTDYGETIETAFYEGKTEKQKLRDTFAIKPDKKGLKEQLATLPENHPSAYNSYYSLARSNFEEPMTTHADHYNTNTGYSIASYSKGAVFLEQLGYVVGASVRDKILLEYYDRWKFKHPNANDFMKVAQDVSGLQLDWYKQYWVNSIKTIDYSIDNLWEENGMSNIRFKRIGLMPMPIDVQITFKDGTTEMHTIPLNLMFGNKKQETPGEKFIVETEWKWTHPTYTISLKANLKDIKKVEIDPSKRLADVDQKNNVLELNW